MISLPRWAGGGRAVRRLGWGTIDQGLSALSNIVITIAVMRGAGVDGLGRFSVAFAAYLTVLGCTRSLVSEPMLTLRRDVRDAEVERAALSMTGLSAAVGAATLAVAGQVSGRPELWALAATIPIVLVHDHLRYVAFRRQQPQRAALLDGGWLLGSLALWPLVSGTSSAVLGLTCWALAALVGIGAGWWLLRPRLCGVLSAVAWWHRDCRPVALPLLFDSLLVVLTLQSQVMLLVGLHGEAALGTLRAAQVYFGPLGTMLTAIGLLALPQLVQRAGPVQTALAWRLSAALAALAVVVSTAVLCGEPLLREQLYAGTAPAPRWLLVALALQTVLSAAAGGLFLASKARRTAGDIARSRLFSTVAGLAVMVPAILWWGLAGAVWALVGQAVVYLVDLAVRVHRTGKNLSEPVVVS